MRTERFKGVSLSILVIASLVVPVVLLSSPSPVHAALTPHAPIYINGNGGFLCPDPVNGGGSGTENDPYIIENWDTSRIHIANTTAHFVIRNCYVHGTYGIDLWRVKKGRIENNTCQNNQEYGISLWYSTNITLNNNKLANNRYNLEVSGSDLSHFIHDIDNTNLVNGKPIYYLIDNSNLVINQDNTVGYLGLISCDNIGVENLVFGSNAQGIFLAYTENSHIENCVFSNNENSIYLWESNNNTLIGNTIDNSNGIRLDYSNTNTLIGNTCDNHRGYWRPGINLQVSDNNTLINNICENNGYGIHLHWSDNNRIYHNNFINNADQASDDGSNYWDNGYPSGGNYWSDYTGVDSYRGENQDILGSDGIGDTPHYGDRYPLIRPWDELWEEIRTVIYPTVDVYAFSGYETGYSRSQLKFDICSIPSGSNILSAKLWLHRFAADNWNGEILLNRVDDQLWGENITATEFDAQTLTNEENRASKFISPGWDYLDVENQLNVDHEAGHTYSSYRLRWANDNGSEPSVGIDDGRFLVIESEPDELSIIFSSSEYNGRDPYLEVVYLPLYKWNLIETWASAIEAHFVWQLIETWTGTVQAPAKWQLVETWTGTVRATSPWRLIEAWTGVIEVPALWQPIETWTGTIRTIGWKLIETWTGTVKALVPVLPAPSLISPADGTITNDSTPTFDWSDVAEAENYDLLVDDDADFSSPEIQVTVPVSTYTTDELPDDNYSWKVRARDAANNVGDWSSIWTLLISAARGVDVFTSPSYQSGLPGATLSYTVTVKNEGNISDTYALTATDSAGWGPTLSKGSLALAPKTYDTVTLIVTIPADASLGDQDNITITAKSTVDPTVSDSAKCTAQATALRRRVEVSISPNIKSGPPGETLTYTVTTVNEGDAEDTYDLTATDALAWGASVSPNSLTIAAGGSDTATVSVVIPAGTASGIEDEITVKATSRSDLTVSDSATCIASAAAVGGVKVSISPETKSGPPEEMLTYTVTVKNEGNVGDTYILSTAGAPDWSPRVENTSLTLNAGRAGETTLTVTIPPGASEGASKTVTVTAISVGDPTVVGSDTCRAIVKDAPERPEVLPIPLTISAFLIGAAILATAYLLRVRSKRAARRRVLRGPRRI
ncbi:MAG: right-handed parallel beta-helix repeat-containing protein [Hadesarchaea archaeon]|nr:right-handed parallel beta-helix repeat-containing protein [Hadesarchaea archaeon]